MTNSRYIAHTASLFKRLNLLQVKEIFDVQCLKFWYRFGNNKLPNYFRDMFKFNNEVHDIEIINHDRLHLYPTRTSGPRNVLRHHIPELLDKFPQYLIDRIKMHSIYSFSHQIKCYLVDLYSYECNDINCYVCNYSREWQIAKAETLYYDCPVISVYTPMCKSNGTFFSDMDINELTSVLHKYKTPVTKYCILICCWVNTVCIRHLIVKMMPEKHVWGPDFLISDSPYIFQLFGN